jgi:phage gp29-like protein
MDIENVSLSRNLEGIPVLKLDNRYLSANATPEEKAFRDLMIRQARSVKRNEQTALVLPSNLDKETKAPLVDLTLLTAGTNVREDQCRGIITASESLMAQSLLANFLKVDGTGSSNATSSSLQDLFILAMKKYVQIVLNVINDEAVISLMKINGMDPVYAPKFTYDGLDTDSLGVFIDALMKSVQAGVVIPTKGLQKAVLRKMNINTSEADEAFDKTESMQEELFGLQKEGMKPEGPGSGGNQQKGGTELNPEKLT